jgi:hypothetical protein
MTQRGTALTQSRRSFLKSGAVVAAASLARPRSAFAAVGVAAPQPPLSQFAYGDVELLEGPLRQQFQTNHAFYLSLDEDSLLKPFRQRAGLSAPGEDMGGWYDWSSDFTLQNMHGFCPGHSFGQYLSGLSRNYAATNSKPTQDKVQRLVRGYAAAISPNFYEGNRFPAYIYDKVSIGLLDAHEFAGDPTALGVLDRAMRTVLPYLPVKALSRDEQYARPHKDETFCWDEFYTLPENMFIAYRRGAGSYFRDLAQRFLADEWYFDPLAVGQNVLPGKHAYSHVNALSSAMQAYLVNGSEKHLRAARNGFEALRATQSFATGGWGPDERFREVGSGEMGESLSKTHSSFETPCGAYAHFKITRDLLRVTKDSRYGDSMEKVLYNTILGAKPIQKNGYGFYYSDYSNDAFKFYHLNKWTCCTGTFAQITADYGISAYFRDSEGVYVNLYVPSRVTWTDGKESISLTQKTSYPHDSRIEIAVSVRKPTKFPIYLRIPAWSGSKTRVKISGIKAVMENESAACTCPPPGEFLRLNQTWKNGDRIQLELDMPSKLEAVDPEHPNLMALVHGPLALFSVGNIPARISQKQLLAAKQIAAGSTDWKAKTDAGDLTLRPFAAINDEGYRLYLNVEPEPPSAV